MITTLKLAIIKEFMSQTSKVLGIHYLSSLEVSLSLDPVLELS